MKNTYNGENLLMHLFNYQKDNLFEEKYWIKINRNIEYLECTDYFVICDNTFDYYPSENNLKILIKDNYNEKIIFKSDYIKNGNNPMMMSLAYSIMKKQTKDGFYVLFDTKNELVNFTLRNRDL